MPTDVTPAELDALRAIAPVLVAWYRGTRSGLDLQDAIREHLAVLADPDPGLNLAWPEGEREPVAGVDYLPPAGDHVYDRVDEVEPDSAAHDRHTIGYSDTGRWYDEAGVAA